MIPKRSAAKSTKTSREMPRLDVPDYYRTTLPQEDVEVLRRLFGVRTPEAAKGLYLAACTAAGPEKPFFRELLFSLAAEMEPRDVAEAMLLLQMGISQIGVTLSAGMMADMKDVETMKTMSAIMNRSARTYAKQFETLRRLRSEPNQVVRVERVMIQDGGQAVVGNVSHGGGHDEK